MELKRGCVVLMKASSGLIGYGNYQCISWVSNEIGELSLYGHNQHYKTYDVEKVIEYPAETTPAPQEIVSDEDIFEILEDTAGISFDCNNYPYCKCNEKENRRCLNLEGLVGKLKSQLHTKEIERLKGLINLTDDDAIEVSKIFGSASHLADESQIAQVKELLTSNKLYNWQTNIAGIRWYRAFKYLESKGYLIEENNL